jgi:hypothetical protein
MLLAIPLSLAVGAFAMWLLMRERTNGALHLAAYTPHVEAATDEVWAEFLREQWSQ